MIKKICAQRQLQRLGSSLRMDEACRCVPDSLSSEDGYHRTCYQQFTKNRDRLEQGSESESAEAGPSRASRRSSRDKLLFNKDCIFCNKEGRKWKRKGGVSVSEDTTVFEMGGGKTIEKCAEEKDDQKLLLRIRGVCLFSVEAQYHPSCRKEYTRQTGLGRSEDDKRRSK